MSPEERGKVSLDLQEYAMGTLDEWLRSAHILQTSEDTNGRLVKIRWEAVTDGVMIASLSETGYGDEFGRYGVTITVEALPDLPPIGPENDPAQIEESRDLAPEWVPATLLYCLAGDRIRIGTEETDVLRSSSGAWHANVVSSVMPSGKTWDKVTPWEHTELRLELAANPGFQQYPPNTACEIRMTAERRAVHTLMSAFPGSTLIDTPPVMK